LEAIAEADLITLGPGSLYTSVIPNLLVKGMSQAIEKSSALKAYFVNLMWQPGETINFAASQHVEALHQHGALAFPDCVVLNTAPVPVRLARRYARANVKPVENDFERLAELRIKVVTADLIRHEETGEQRVRHDSAALAEVVIDLASRSRAHRIRKDTLATQRAGLATTRSGYR
jgi:uncharacterized cofD-like protein